MKHLFLFSALVFTATFCQAQYSKEKLTDILTGGSTKAWTVKSANATQAEKAFTFSKDLSVTVSKSNGIDNEKWALSSADNIRWFITVGRNKYELIVSYDKAGAQFLKLTSQAGDKTVYSEMLLYPSK